MRLSRPLILLRPAGREVGVFAKASHKSMRSGLAGSSGKVPVPLSVAIKQRAAASPGLSSDPAHMKFERVHHDPDGDEAGPDKPLGSS